MRYVSFLILTFFLCFSGVVITPSSGQESTAIPEYQLEVVSKNGVKKKVIKEDKKVIVKLQDGTRLKGLYHIENDSVIKIGLVETRIQDIQKIRVRSIGKLIVGPILIVSGYAGFLLWLYASQEALITEGLIFLYGYAWSAGFITGVIWLASPYTGYDLRKNWDMRIVRKSILLPGSETCPAAGLTIPWNFTIICHYPEHCRKRC